MLWCNVSPILGVFFYVEDKLKMRITVYGRIERLGRNRRNMERILRVF